MNALNNDYIINCVKAFYKFEHFLNKMNGKLGYDFEENFGYLINYERIDKIKKAINYENNKEIYKNLSPSPADQVKKIYTIDEIKFRNSDYLLNMLQNKNNYIIINNELWKVFCKNDKEKLAPIKYYINYGQIKFKLDDQKELIFSFEFQKNDNLITFKKFYISDNPYYDHFRSNYNNLVNDIYKPIKEYYEFHKKFVADLGVPKRSDLQSGFLVDIDWFKEWEQFYDFIINIKAKYLDHNANEKDIIDCLIYFSYANKRDINQLSKPEIYKFSNSEEMISFIKNKKLMIVNSSLITSSSDISTKKSTYFYLGKNTIEFIFDDGKHFIFEMKDNVLSLKADDNEENQHLIQLIKIYYFKKYIINEMPGIKIKYETKEIILIKKDIINKYLKSFDYTKLFDYLSKTFESINYKNLENNLETLLKIIKRDLKDYYDELNLKEDLANSFNFIGNEYELKQKPYTYKEKTLKYIDDFDIIDKDIFSFFVNNNIIKKNQVIKGEYISDKGQIFLAYDYDGVNNFQIVSLNKNKNGFITEYIIECGYSLNNIIINIIKSNGIKSFLQNQIGDKIYVDNKSYGYCYPVQHNTDDISTTKDNSDNSNYNIVEIVSTLISLYLFENDMKKNLEFSKSNIKDLTKNISANPLSTINCKIINGNYLTEIKKLFNYQKIIDLVNKYNNKGTTNIFEQIKITLQYEESYKNFLLSKNNEFSHLKARVMELFSIEKTLNNNSNDKFQYPINFNLIKDSIFDKLINILDLNNSNPNYINKSEEVMVTYNNGKIAFKGLKDNFFGNYKSLLYIYSLNFSNDYNEIIYTPEAILDFKTNTDLNKQFPLIMKEKIIHDLRNYSHTLSVSYGFEICLISKRDNNNSGANLKDSEIYDNDKNKYYNQLIFHSLIFYLQSKNFYEQEYQVEEKVYLINKYYMNEIKSILQLEEIAEVLKNNNEIEKKLFAKDSSVLTLLKKSLKKTALDRFCATNKNDLINKLNNSPLYDLTSKIFYAESTKLYYYENCQIISEKMFENFIKIDSNIKQKCVKADAIFSDNKAILLLKENNNYIINVGQMDNSHEFIIDFLIYSEDKSYNEFDINKIFSFIKKIGYYYFQSKYIKNNEIKIEKDNISIYAKIYKIIPEEKLKFLTDNLNMRMNQYFSEKLKAMVLLVISQNIDPVKFHEYGQKKAEKVYLMNPKYLILYRYKEIFSLIKGNNQIKDLVEQINEEKYPYDSNILDQILSKLNQGELIKIDKILGGTDLRNSDWEATPEYITLKHKKIKVYKEFILVKEKIFDEIKIKLSSSKKEVYYAYNNGDIIAIKDYYDPVIFFGSINNESHLFSIRYILHLKFESYLKDELKFIQKNGMLNYIKINTLLNLEDSKEFVSPIYNNNNEIGHIYKFIPGVDYSQMKQENYENYLNSTNFTKIMNLYDYYEEFKINLNKGYLDRSYYLINKDIMNSIKKDYKYETIIQTLNKMQLKSSEQNKQKRKLLILKNLPGDFIEKFIKTPKDIEKCIKNFVSPETLKFNIPDSPDSVNIYKNFEIISPSVATQFIDGIYNYGSQSSDNNFIECYARDGKIIIYYTKYKLNNDQYVYQIGNLNDDNTFIPEYLIIYKKDHAHFDNIKYELNNYLQSIDNSFVNGVFPITISKSSSSFYFKNEVTVEEIGKIICLRKINNYGGFINPNPNNDKNKYKDDIPRPKPPEDNYDTELSNYLIREYNLEPKFQNVFINQNFAAPPLIGLDNIGATCYMNATLQCLCNIPKFVNYFKYNKHLIEYVKNDLVCGNATLSSSFKLLIEKLWPDRLYFTNNNYPSNGNYGHIGSNNSFSNKKNESYAPKEFKTKISSMNSLFEGVQANDAKDLVNFLIMTLHTELNTAQNNSMNNNAINLNQTNQQLMFKIFSEDFMKNNKSIISDLFYGVNYNVIQCQGCMTKSFNYQTYFFFVFPLEEVRIFKSQNNFNNNNFNNFNYNMNFNNNDINIYDCFLYEQRINYMTGQNAMYCNYCKQTCNSSMCTLLSFGPEIIIVILNRGQGIQYKVKINFPIELNLYNFIDFKDTGFNYELIGVITHMGGSDMSGHFIAYCKNPINNTWYQYNDSVVNEVNQYNFKAEVVDYAMPYLLFYQKVNK